MSTKPTGRKRPINGRLESNDPSLVGQRSRRHVKSNKSKQQEPRWPQSQQDQIHMTTPDRGVDGNNHIVIQEENLAHRPTPSEFSTESGQFKYGAQSVIDLFIPVSICIWIVVGTMKATDRYHYTSQTVLWYAQMMFDDQKVDIKTRIWQSFANAFIMLILIMVTTTLLIFLYKFRCYKTIYGWLVMSSLVLLFAFMLMYISVFLKVYNIAMDQITLGIFIWNFGVVGMVCIHWKGPLQLQQAYLIMVSALMALVFIQSLPDWTVWTVLTIVSIWDLVAVLCPSGPLRMLVELAQERNEPIFPALIYSSTMLWELSTVATSSTSCILGIDNNNNNNSINNNPSRPERTERSSLHGQHSRLVRMSLDHSPSKAGNSINSPRKHRRQSSESSSSRYKSPLNSPRKRSDNHPVEIQYDDGAEAPKVTIIHPTILDNVDTRSEDNWQRASRVRGSRTKPTKPSEDITRKTPRRSLSYEPMSAEPNVQQNNLVHNFDQITGQQETSFQQIGETVNNEINRGDEEERGVKLGLGDFIFYSLLVGKVSSFGDWTVTISCYVSVLVGLCLTLSLLTIFRKALPALPISIAFGLSSSFLSYSFAEQLSARLVMDQIFI